MIVLILAGDVHIARNAVHELSTGVNPAGDAGDTSPHFLVGGRQWEYPPILLRTFGYSRPILVALRSLRLKPISFGYKTPPIRFSQAGGQSAHKARPSNLELALTPLELSNSGQFAESAANQYEVHIIHSVAEKRNHFSFMNKSFRTQYNLTTFSTLIVNECYHRCY